MKNFSFRENAENNWVMSRTDLALKKKLRWEVGWARMGKGEGRRDCREKVCRERVCRERDCQRKGAELRHEAVLDA